MIERIARGTCDRCGAVVEVDESEAVHPDERDVIMRNPGWTAFIVSSHEAGRVGLVTSRLALCPECSAGLAGFLTSGRAASDK